MAMLELRDVHAYYGNIHALDGISLTVDEGRLLWRDREVYSKPLGPDNFAFRFFKDGIRQLALLPGVEEGELAEFIELLAHSRQAHDDDLLATLWHRDFKTIRMDYVDAGEEEQADVPRPDRNAGAGDTLEDMTEIEAVLEQHPSVAHAVAAVRDERQGDRRLVGYIVPKENAPARW